MRDKYENRRKRRNSFEPGDKLVFDSETKSLRAYGPDRNRLLFFEAGSGPLNEAEVIELGFVNSPKDFLDFAVAMGSVCECQTSEVTKSDTEPQEWIIKFLEI